MGKARRTNNHVNTNCGKICIKIPARKLMPVSNSQIVRISAEAYNDLVEIYNQSTLSLIHIFSFLVVIVRLILVNIASLCSSQRCVRYSCLQDAKNLSKTSTRLCIKS